MVELDQQCASGKLIGCFCVSKSHHVVEAVVDALVLRRDGIS